MVVKKGIRMRRRLVPVIGTAVVFGILSFGCELGGGRRVDTPPASSNQGQQPGRDPLQASYLIEEQTVQLHQGRAESEAAPDSVSRIVTAVFDEPVYGDLDGDGDEDTALVLVHDPGGSGTFYYVAAALNTNGSHRGTNAVLLGDRIRLEQVDIAAGVLSVRYMERQPDQSMAAAPTAPLLKHLVVNDGRLEAVRDLSEGEQLLFAWVTLGHEVRSVVPCSRDNTYWLTGRPETLDTINASYYRVMSGTKPYTPLFMVLAGRFADPPASGFGASFDGVFWVSQLVKVWPTGSCND